MGLFDALLAVGLLTTAYLLLFIGRPLKRLWPVSRTVPARNIPSKRIGGPHEHRVVS